MPAVPTPPTVTDGVVPSSLWNQYRDAIKFSQSPPRFELRQTAAQTLTTGVETAINMDTEEIDTDVDGTGGHTGGSPSLWICRYPGVYLLDGKVAFLANATGLRIAWLQVNGSDVVGTGNTASGTASFDLPLLTKSKKVALEEGDQVRLMALQTSGGNLNTYVALARYQSVLSGLWVSIR